MLSVLSVLLLFLLGQTPNLDHYLAAEKAFAANPRSEDKMVALASVLYENAQNDRAITLLESFVKANPRASRARLFLALGYARVEKYAQARTLASQVATGLPADYYAQHILGLALFGLNDFDAAEARFKKTIALKPDFADAYYQLGLLDSRNPATLQRGLANYQRALELGYKQPELFRNIASVDAKLGKYNEAIGSLNRALELNPNYADAYFQLADAYRKSGKAEEAANATRKFQELNASAVELKQRRTKAQGSYEQGMGLLQKNDLVNAYNAFKSAADSSPEMDAAFYRMAQIEYLHDDTAQAVAHLRHSLELNPFEAEYYFVLSRCLEDTDRSSAIEAANKAISLNGRVADFHNLLGDLYAEAGDFGHAVQAYRRAVELDPKNPEFKKSLAAAERKVSAGRTKPE